MEQVKVLFVCMGNICRSPTAEGIFRKLLTESGLASQVSVDSAGTTDYHTGEPPDRRAQAAALKRGVDLSRQRARQVSVTDFETFDYVLAMDRENYHNLQALCPPDKADRLALFMSFAPQTGVEEVPDPYFGGTQGFEQVLDLIEAASKELLQAVRRRLPQG